MKFAYPTSEMRILLMGRCVSVKREACICLEISDDGDDNGDNGDNGDTVTSRMVTLPIVRRTTRLPFSTRKPMIPIWGH